MAARGAGRVVPVCGISGLLSDTSVHSHDCRVHQAHPAQEGKRLSCMPECALLSRTRVERETFKYLVAKYVKKAGIRKKVSVHALRHTFGAYKADKQMGIATLHELMGQKKKETTLKYIHLAKTNLRQERIETALLTRA